MDEKNNKLFECDILICGTSLLNTLLSVYFSIKNYNVINIDKNNYYGDYNGSLNFCQFQNEHNELENFYYEFLPFSNLTQIKKKELQDIVQNYMKINNNKFNIDINPKIIYNESNIVNLLVSLNAHTYISFLGPNQSLAEDSQKVKGSLREIKERGTQQQNNNGNNNNDDNNDNKYDNDDNNDNKYDNNYNKYDNNNNNNININYNNINNNNINKNNFTIPPHDDENVNIINYLNTFNITDKISDYIIYGIGLFDLDLGYCKHVHNIPEYYLSGFSKETKYVLNKNEFLKRLHILVNSLNKFKLQNLFENAFIYPSYGLNDIIYALSRVACLNDSIYMINRKIKHITYSNYNYTKKTNATNMIMFKL
ncbi:hypothetical protein PFDG_04505 [Plasmodium falciparum Dd2]|uniref:GDP dissociation inhibitor n=1 Tax=Plasmodium falciparum (isolate Dd2) TaxID=57267 RepID=A0A0L7M571_PLAF4|nr:hypothetical protein PFDG_04505 [Plasmodium falciparum Dd2]